MASTDPWEIGNQFTKMLYDQRTRERGYDVDYAKAQYATDIARANADTAWGRQLELDKINFGQSQELADQQRRFQHDENKLINLDYKLAAKNRGRAGHVAAPAAAGVGGEAAPTGGGINAQTAFQHYTQRGVPPIVAAGIVGNIAAESGWRPDVFSGTARGDDGTAYGAGQWRGSRQEHLFEFAQGRGHPRPTPEDQLDFYVEEGMSGRDPGARQALDLASQAQTPEEAAQIFMKYYERPKDNSSLAHRQAAAREVFAGGGAAAPAPGVNPSMPAATSPGRRYYDPNAEQQQQPVKVTDGTVPKEDTQPSAATPEFTAPLPAWTEKDFTENGIRYTDTLDVPTDMDVVDTQFLSGAQLDQLQHTAPEMLDRLIPVGGYDPEETNQYLILQPKPTNPLYQKYYPNAAQPVQPVQPGAPVQQPVVEDAINAPPISTPQAAAPPPVDQRVVSGVGTEPVSAAAPTSTAPTGQRTRRNADGVLEFLVDGQWRASGVGG